METTLIDKLVSSFRKAATELEELQVQLSLGKAEAKDAFEVLKKRMNLFLHEAQSKAEDAKEWADEVKTKFDELRVQIALGKAETEDAFNAQRKKIELKLNELQNYIQSHPTLSKVYDYVTNEIERIKLELEILAANFKIARLKTKDSLDARRKDLDKIIAQLQEGLKKHQNSEEPGRREHFRSEITQAFHHLKAAFS